MGILEDHVNVWEIVGIFWGLWEICPACILQFQFLSYIEALYMLSELPELSKLSKLSKVVAFAIGPPLQRPKSLRALKALGALGALRTLRGFALFKGGPSFSS